DEVLVADVALDELHALVLERVLEVAGRAAGHVVQDHDLGRLLVEEELVDRGRTDEAGASGHQDFGAFDLHVPSPTLLFRLAPGAWIVEPAASSGPIWSVVSRP